MSVCLLLISDGRDDYRQQTVASAKKNLPRFDALEEVEDPDHSKGFAGAIAEGWERVLATGCEYCFWLEADYTFNQPVPLNDMRRVLERCPHLVQMVLLRQPWNEQEREAGGIIQQHPADFDQITDESGHSWIEHRRFFSTNPCLLPTWVMRSGWPQEPESEGKFGINLFASDPRLRSAYWGKGEEWVRHIGEVRIGLGY